MPAGLEATDLLQPLIEGVVEEPPWQAFLDRLRARIDAGYVSIVFRPFREGPERNRVIHLYSGRPSPPIVSRHYHDNLHLTDPVAYQEMEDGRVYALAELLRLGDPAHDSYVNELLVPSGMSVLRMMRVVEASGVRAWLTVSRRDGEFAPQVDELLEALAPFWRAALRSYVALERERITGSVAKEAIRRMSFGWLTLDAAGRILDADQHGASLLKGRGLLMRGRGGRLTSCMPEVARAISAAASALHSDPLSRPRAIVLSREPWLDMLLVAADISGGTTGPAPALVAYVHSDNWTSADRCEQLGQLFDLAPSEARLALALSRGMSIAEAAGDLGLTIESARTYSKRIYAKTGARGQADLVRFVHRSVLAIA